MPLVESLFSENGSRGDHPTTVMLLITKLKLSLFQLAEELRNMSHARQIMG